jgi:hypothetical protein
MLASAVLGGAALGADDTLDQIRAVSHRMLPGSINNFMMQSVGLQTTISTEIIIAHGSAYRVQETGFVMQQFMSCLFQHRNFARMPQAMSMSNKCGTPLPTSMKPGRHDASTLPDPRGSLDAAEYIHVFGCLPRYLGIDDSTLQTLQPTGHCIGTFRFGLSEQGSRRRHGAIESRSWEYFEGPRRITACNNRQGGFTFDYQMLPHLAWSDTHVSCMR